MQRQRTSTAHLVTTIARQHASTRDGQTDGRTVAVGHPSTDDRQTRSSRTQLVGSALGLSVGRCVTRQPHGKSVAAAGGQAVLRAAAVAASPRPGEECDRGGRVSSRFLSTSPPLARPPRPEGVQKLIFGAQCERSVARHAALQWTRHRRRPTDRLQQVARRASEGRGDGGQATHFVTGHSPPPDTCLIHRKPPSRTSVPQLGLGFRVTDLEFLARAWLGL